MFKFLHESEYEGHNEETMEGLKNFLFLVGMLAVLGIMMAFVAFWLGHK